MRRDAYLRKRTYQREFALPPKEMEDKLSEGRIFVSIDIEDETVPVDDLWYRFRKGRSSSSFFYHDK
jgi:hypothetical protein